MSYRTYHIPANFTDAGKFMGLFSIRNSIEAAVLCAPLVFLCFRLLPFSLTTNIIIALLILVPTGGFALIGIRDDCLSRFIAMWWRWRRRRGIRTYCGTIILKGKERRQA